MDKLIELIKYGFWGGITTLFNLGLFYLMTEGGMDYILANVLSYTLAVVLSYFLNEKLVFQNQSEENRAQKMVKFVLVRAVSLCLDSAILYLCVTVLGKNKMGSKFIISACIILATYIFNKLFVFKELGGRDEK